jgi:hypothetical protein
LETLKEAYVSTRVTPKNITTAQTLTENTDPMAFNDSLDPVMESVLKFL